MGEHEASKDDLNARGLWQIATELVDAKVLPQAIQVLEVRQSRLNKATIFDSIVKLLGSFPSSSE
jgi:hypothetical protein